MFDSKKRKHMTYIVSGVYMVLLVWLVLFKFSTSLSDLSHIRNINVIPFYYDTEVSAIFHIKEVLYNVLIFAPLGVYVSIFKPDWSFLKKILPGLFISFVFEVCQFIFAIGASDITDIIGNTMGGVIGILSYSLIKKIFKKKHITIINTIGLVIEIVAVLLLGILFIANK